MKRRPNANTVLANTDVFTVETDSPAERRGFELVWGFSCQVVVVGLLPVLCRPGGSEGRRTSRSGRRDDMLVVAAVWKAQPSHKPPATLSEPSGYLTMGATGAASTRVGKSRVGPASCRLTPMPGSANCTSPGRSPWPIAEAACWAHGRRRCVGLTWILPDLKLEVLERAVAAQIYGPSLPPRRDLRYPCRLLPWPAEVRAGAPFSRPRLAVGCWPSFRN